ncbi:MAG: hypothetical protein AAF763_01205 [Pseudomonadota bacterium]
MSASPSDRRALKRLAEGAAARGGPRLALGPGAALLRGRVHEICGPSRRSLAALLAATAERNGEGGPILWIRAPGVDGRPGADGLARFFNPGRLVIATPRRTEDAPWCAEEALRAGACGLVLVELTSPLRLTPVRRLHLAARAGAERAAEAGAPPPLALLLVPGDGGCEGVESRWFCSPEAAAASARMPRDASGRGPDWPSGGAETWRLELRRARLSPPRRWHAIRRSEASGPPLRLVPAGAPKDLATLPPPPPSLAAPLRDARAAAASAQG